MKAVDNKHNKLVKFASIHEYEQYIRQLRHPNTLFALAAYDNFIANCWEKMYGPADIMRVIEEGDRFGALVGRAYGYDTKAFNSPETCEGCVRSGTWLREQVGLL
jgi:uncharacterized short protein YbdD (DUF466 family)